MRASAWLSAMILQYGVRMLFAFALCLGFALSIWLTVVVVNWYRDRDERRNVDEKSQRIITAKTSERDYWHRRCEDAEALAGKRLAIIRASTAAINHAGIQLRGATDAEDVPVGALRKVRG